MVQKFMIQKYDQDTWNIHKESEIHAKHEIGTGTKLLFTFLSLKFFRHEERETPCGARSAQSRLASPSSRSEAGTQLTAFSQISAHASGV